MDYRDPNPNLVKLFDYFFFSLFYPSDGWKSDEDLRIQFYNAVEKYLSNHRDVRYLGLVNGWCYFHSYERGLKLSDIELHPENNAVYIHWDGDDEDEYYSLSILGIRLTDEEASIVRRRKETFPLRLECESFL